MVPQIKSKAFSKVFWSRFLLKSLLVLLMFLFSGAVWAAPSPIWVSPADNVPASVNYTSLNASMSNVVTANNISVALGASTYRLYDADLIFLASFNNISSLGENATSFKDVSILNQTGTCVSCPNTTSSGKYNGAVQFATVNSNVINFTKAVNPFFSGAAGTMCAWVYITTTSANYGIFGDRNNTAGNWFQMQITSADKFMFGCKNSTTEKSLLGTSVIANNEWHFYCGTWNSSGIYSYIDAALYQNDTTQNCSNVVDGSQSLFVGNYHDWTRSLYGKVDEAMVYNRSLTVSELQFLYRTNLYKYNATAWTFYTNYTGLLSGPNTYSIYVNDSTGNTLLSQTIYGCVTPVVTSNLSGIVYLCAGTYNLTVNVSDNSRITGLGTSINGTDAYLLWDIDGKQRLDDI
jgi:hypothetical protein